VNQESANPFISENSEVRTHEYRSDVKLKADSSRFKLEHMKLNFRLHDLRDILLKRKI
jgi:hypothetical protein